MHDVDDQTGRQAATPIFAALRPHTSATVTTRRRRWPFVVSGVLLIILVLGVLAGMRARSALAAYRDVRDEVAVLEALQAGDLSSMQADDLRAIEQSLTQLHDDLGRLDAAVTPPVGAGLVERLPMIGPRYTAGKRLIRAVDTLTTAGIATAAIGRETLTAFRATGIRRSPDDTGPTWLDVLMSHQEDLDTILAQVDEARRIRAGIDAAALPASARARLPALDRALDALDPLRLVNDDLPVFATALGAEEPARYLILFQNTAELRLSGGFPGTIALVTFEHGQLASYEFHDIYDLQQAYQAGRTQPITPPYPVAHHFGHEELPIQDATWETDFAAGAARLVEMYRATGWPAINGVVAVTPAVVSDILGLTGPVTVEVDGEPRRIDADNVHDEIERQRYVHGGNETAPSHKAVLALLGRVLIERLTAADRALLLDLIRTMRTAADERDVQVYAVDPRLQAMADEHRWSGRLLPQPGVPTLALNASSLVTTKASRAVHPQVTLTIEPPVNGQRIVTLAADFVHTGDPTADPYYAGYQRWWVEVTLPEGSTRLDSSHEPQPDPDAPNGGSYDLEIFAGETTHFTVRFTMPDSPQLLIRRQPGITPVELTATTQGCQAPVTATLTADLTLDLTTLCR
ncbi:DUF4012 domain-containing protein [Sphaerobacter sp.]|uniref:DUF4012 domain-containing protein n=1 Tax=Sphaerobacter sp. TaxID=2099654 RepID=UPI001E0B0198|nr:DUF4012 domain-containing protein [Sphaerobacter sp.]MBX5445397.1 DUF4012 domain-containing protein [Sphaerobacter sp.]